MVPTMTLPNGTRVLEVSARVRSALEQLDALEPTRYALAHWLRTEYRHALVLENGEEWPLVLHVTSEVPVVVAEAQAAVARARQAAREGKLLESLPMRVHVLRVRDESGATGFAPIDVRGASLTARALALLLSDYLMRPEAYAPGSRAA